MKVKNAEQAERQNQRNKTKKESDRRIIWTLQVRRAGPYGLMDVGMVWQDVQSASCLGNNPRPEMGIPGPETANPDIYSGREL